MDFYGSIPIFAETLCRSRSRDYQSGRVSARVLGPFVFYMTPKQRMFVNEYIKDCNATQAAIRAGYAPKDADVHGPAMRANPVINFAIEEKLKAIGKKTETDVEYIRRVLKTVIERGLLPVPVMVFDHESKEYIQKIDPESGQGVWEYDATAVVNAASWLGKAYKMFTEKFEVSGIEGFAEKLKRAKERAKRG